MLHEDRTSSPSFVYVAAAAGSAACCRDTETEKSPILSDGIHTGYRLFAAVRDFLLYFPWGCGTVTKERTAPFAVRNEKKESKHMKRTNTVRLLALMLALMMVLCACGDSKETVSGSVSPAATEVPEKEVSMGRLEGGVYTNNYAGFQMTLDSDWVYYSAEELQELPENVAEMFKDTDLGETAANLEQFTDMMAESTERLASVNVLYQKLDMKTRLAYAVLSDAEILDEVLKISDQMVEAYAAAGITVDRMEKVTVNFLGQERVALKTYASIQGLPYFTLQVFEYHLGQYSVTTTFATYLEDNTESLLDLCAPIA
jgi:hypothetical protein